MSGSVALWLRLNIVSDYRDAARPRSMEPLNVFGYFALVVLRGVPWRLSFHALQIGHRRCHLNHFHCAGVGKLSGSVASERSQRSVWPMEEVL
jgi:hypothetical protein